MSAESTLQANIDSESSARQSADTALANAKQDKQLSSSISIDGASAGTVEVALSTLNAKKANNTSAVGSFTLSIDSSTYVISLQAKNINGDNLGSAQIIDLPLESVVISGSYDSESKKIILTLKNGSQIEFSVADLINGLQPEITGAATSITEDNLTVSKALVSDESGKVAASAVTATELSQLSGVTSNVQEQLNNSIHYCTVLPSAPENRVYGTKETDSFSGAVKKLALTYFELSNGTYVPKKQVKSTSLNIGSESSVNVTTISSDFTSINGSITVTDSTAVSGTVTVVRMYAGDTTNRAYYPFGSGDGGNGGMTVECTGADCSYPFVFYDTGNGTGYVSCCCPISYNPSSGILDTTVFGVRGDYVGFDARYDTCCSSLAVIHNQIVSSVTNGEQTADRCVFACYIEEYICGCCCGTCFKNRRLIDISCVHSCVCMCGCDPEYDTIYCVSNTVYQEPNCAGIWYCDNLTCKCQEIRLASAGIGYSASCHDFSGNILVRGCLHDLCGCAYAKVCDIGTSLKTECADTIKSNSLTEDTTYNLALWNGSAAECYCDLGFSGGRSITYNPYTATLNACCGNFPNSLSTDSLSLGSAVNVATTGVVISQGNGDIGEIDSGGKLWWSGNANFTCTVTAACFCGNATSATSAASVSTYNCYCLDYMCSSADRPLLMTTASDASNTPTVGEIGRATNCRLTFNPNSGTLKIAGSNGCFGGLLCVNQLCVGGQGIRTYYDIVGYNDDTTPKMTWYIYCDGQAQLCCIEVQENVCVAGSVYVCGDCEVISTANIGNYLTCQCRVSLETYLACTSLCSNVLYLVY